MSWKLSDVTCFFLRISWKKDGEEGNCVALDGTKSQQRMTKGLSTHYVHVLWQLHFFVTGEESGQEFVWLPVTDRKRGLFFNFGLHTLTGLPLSARALLTPWLPSIPGLFLCGRQHPASGCLTVSEHPCTWMERGHWDKLGRTKKCEYFQMSYLILQLPQLTTYQQS